MIGFLNPYGIKNITYTGISYLLSFFCSVNCLVLSQDRKMSWNPAFGIWTQAPCQVAQFYWFRKNKLAIRSLMSLRKKQFDGALHMELPFLKEWRTINLFYFYFILLCIIVLALSSTSLIIVLTEKNFQNMFVCGGNCNTRKWIERRRIRS